MMHISLLSTIDSPILGYIIEAFLRHGAPVHSILLDPTPYSAKNKGLFDQRTGNRMPPIPLATFEGHAIPFFFFSSHTSVACREYVTQNSIDILVNAGTPRILPAGVLESPRMGVLNCHPGLLPDYRGCSCVEWALWNNDPVGNTVHLMTAEIDRGPILRKEPITRNPHDTYQDIRIKAYLEGFDLLARTVKQLINGDMTEADFEPGTEGTYYKPMPDDVFQKLLKRLPGSHESDTR